MSNLKLPLIKSYATADRCLDGKNERKIGYQTWLVRLDNGNIAVKHFNTLILRYVNVGDSASVVYSPRGYHTRTTLHRLHHFSPPGVCVYTKNYTAYVQHPNGEVRLLEDGLSLDENGFHPQLTGV